MTSADTREPKLVVTDSRGLRIEWGGDGQCFTDEQVLEKMGSMRDAVRDLGVSANVTLHIVAPQPLSIVQRASILCELWFDVKGKPTQEQWEQVLEDMWQSSLHIARERGEPRPEKPPFPPRPMRALQGSVSPLRSVGSPSKDYDPETGGYC